MSVAERERRVGPTVLFAGRAPSPRRVEFGVLRLILQRLESPGRRPAGLHRITKDLVTAIDDYPAITNDTAPPLTWTKTADDTLASVARSVNELQTQDAGAFLPVGAVRVKQR